MQDPMLVVGFLAILCVIYVADRLVQWRRNANLAPLPPGPKGLPLVGNLRDLPEPGVLEAEHWAKLAEYGKLSYFRLLRTCKVCAQWLNGLLLR